MLRPVEFRQPGRRIWQPQEAESGGDITPAVTGNVLLNSRVYQEHKYRIV
jgi:hypothetical protein